MKIKTFGMKTALIFTVCAAVISFPLSAAAENSNTSVDSSVSSQSEGMTSEDWEELQNEAKTELSAQNSEENKAAAATTGENENPKGGSFKDFKDGSYVGNGEWLLAIGIILVVLGVAGIAFIVFMMIRRRRLLNSMSAKRTAMQAKREKSVVSDKDPNSLFIEAGEAVRSYSGNRPSGRRIAPKSNK